MLEELRVAEEEMHQQNEELVLARDALESERQRYRELFEFAPDAYLVTSPDGVIQEVNRATSSLLGIEPRLLVGKPFVTFVAPEERLTFLAELQRLRGALRIQDWDILLRPRRAAAPLAAALTAEVVQGRDREPVALRWLIRDVSGRRRAEEERYRLLVEDMTDYAIFLLDAGNRITFWNSGAERLFGYTAAEMIGQPSALIFTPEDREHGVPEQEMRTALTQGRADDERWHVRKDGSRFFASGVLTALRNGAPPGHIRSFAKVLRDLTQRKRAEIQQEATLKTVEKAREDLERRVHERTAALTKANQALQAEVLERKQSEAARQALLRQLVTAQEEERRRISRELHDQTGQHLTALTLGLKTLEDSWLDGSPPPPRLLPRLQQIAEELAREVHELSVELRPTALDDMGLRTAVMNYAEDWGERHRIAVDFHSRGMGSERFPSAIETTIYRIVQEALNNVLKHAQATRASIILERHGQQVRAIVEDNGVGFDTEAAAEAASASGVARRLGLLGMKERASLVGGDLRVESSPGEGTTVFLRIPLPQAGAPGGKL